MTLRATNVAKLDRELFDVVIIGAGINGSVSAAALAAKGAHVALIERNDFAGFTSQNSSNLAWGGIKYMESGELGLVRKLCMSRNHLMRAYPSTVKEIRFLTSVEKSFRWSPFMLWVGAWIYWFFGSFFTRRPHFVSVAELAKREPAVDTSRLRGGFEYSDAYLHDNDARFVFGFVRRAMTNGCIAANYVESLGAERDADGLWVVGARDRIDDREFTVRAKTMINACGPYVDAHNRSTGIQTKNRHLFSKGIHLIVDRISPERRVLTFFADDGRPFFAIPMGNRTVIGTTDTRVQTPETEVTDEDREFVLRNINRQLNLDPALTKGDVIAERCGVRPLVIKSSQGDEVKGDWTKLSRKHIVDADPERQHLSIFGGKLTDCINVGDEVSDAVHALGIPLPYRNHRWYGEPPTVVRDDFMHQAKLLRLDALTAEHASEPLSQRLWRRYGARAIGMLEDIRQDPRMAEVMIGTSEYLRCEIYRTRRHEMVVNLEDFLRRRSKIALVVKRERLLASRGLREACEVLFGDDARAQWEAYFGVDWETGL